MLVTGKVSKGSYDHAAGHHENQGFVLVENGRYQLYDAVKSCAVVKAFDIRV